MFYEMIGFATSQGDVTESHLPEIDLDKAALLLDFDGVLADIAETPDQVQVPDDLPGLLDALVERTGGATAVISGRALAVLQDILPDFKGTLMGCHGAEVAGAGEVRGYAPPDARHVAAVIGMVQGYGLTDPAYAVEAKPTGVVLHFRRKPELRGSAYRFLEAAIHDLPGFEIHYAKMALEIRPAGVSKGSAVERLMQDAPFAGRRPLYAGDDTSDEEAFALVNAANGLSVKVGEGDTCAHFRTPDPATLRAALATLIRD